MGELVRDELDLSLRNPFMDELPEYLTDIHPDEGEVVCLCRSITRGEILAALRSPLPPTTLDGLKRHTGAIQTNVQGIYAIGIVTATLLDHADSIAMGIVRITPLPKSLEESDCR